MVSSHCPRRARQMGRCMARGLPPSSSTRSFGSFLRLVFVIPSEWLWGCEHDTRKTSSLLHRSLLLGAPAFCLSCVLLVFEGFLLLILRPWSRVSPFCVSLAVFQGFDCLTFPFVCCFPFVEGCLFLPRSSHSENVPPLLGKATFFPLLDGFSAFKFKGVCCSKLTGIFLGFLNVICCAFPFFTGSCLKHRVFDCKGQLPLEDADAQPVVDFGSVLFGESSSRERAKTSGEILWMVAKSCTT